MIARLLTLVLLVAALPAQAADIRPFVKGSWGDLTAAHAGRPLVVHFWSLGCAPCLAELPQWSKLARERRFDLVLVTPDPIEDRARIAAMLRRHGLDGIESWAFADPFTERLRFEIDRGWRGELPMTRVVPAGGEAETVIGSLKDGGLAARLVSLGGAR